MVSTTTRPTSPVDHFHADAMTTEEVAESFLKSRRERDLADKTLDYYQWSLDKLISQCPEWPSCADQVAGAWASPALGRVSRRNVERGIRIFLSWAEKTHGCPNPLSGREKMRKVKTLPRVLAEEEVAAVLSACDTAQERAIVALLLDTGIRVGELADLHWSNVGRDSLNVSGKTGARVVPVSPCVRKMLDGLGDHEHIWVSRKGPMSRYAVRDAVYRVFKRSGLEGPKLGAHLLRHTFATHYIDGGGNVAHLQRILGHTSLETTMIYVNLSAIALRQDHAKYSPALRFLGHSH